MFAWRLTINLFVREFLLLILRYKLFGSKPYHKKKINKLKENGNKKTRILEDTSAIWLKLLAT